MVRREPLLLGIFGIVLMYTFSLPTIGLTIPQVSGICLISFIKSTAPENCRFYSDAFYGIWIISIILILLGIFSGGKDKSSNLNSKHHLPLMKSFFFYFCELPKEYNKIVKYSFQHIKGIRTRVEIWINSVIFDKD